METKKLKRRMGKTEKSCIDLAPLIDWVLKQKELKNKFESLLASYPYDPMISSEFILEAFIFDYKLDSGKTPLELFIEKLSESEKKDYLGLIDNVYSLFEIKEVKIGKGMKLYDIINNKEYWIKEKRATYETKVGNIISFRIAKIGNSFISVCPGGIIWPSEAGYLMKRIYGQERPKERLTAFDILDATLKTKKKTTLEEAIKAFKEKIRKLGIKINLENLDERINSNKTLSKAFPEIFKFNFQREDDLQEMLDILTDLWNNYPRKEFGGKTPSEMSKIGPKEEMLMYALFAEAQAKINPDDYPSARDAEKAFQKFQKEWLYKPQKELNGKSPMQVILEERKKLNNPRKDFLVKLKLTKK